MSSPASWQTSFIETMKCLAFWRRPKRTSLWEQPVAVLPNRKTDEIVEEPAEPLPTDEEVRKSPSKRNCQTRWREIGNGITAPENPGNSQPIDVSIEPRFEEILGHSNSNELLAVPDGVAETQPEHPCLVDAGHKFSYQIWRDDSCATNESVRDSVGRYQRHFPGEVYRQGAVSVRGIDGLLQYGVVVGTAGSQLLVDFLCGNNRVCVVPMHKVYHLSEEKAIKLYWIDCSTDSSYLNAPVEVLLCAKPDEVWKWHPALCIHVLRHDGLLYAVVQVFAGVEIAGLVCIRAKQIRVPSDEADLHRLAVHNVQDIGRQPHTSLPSDPPINTELPPVILGEILDCLDSPAQRKLRRVCTVWRHVADTWCTKKCLRLRASGIPFPELADQLCSMWHEHTQFLSLTDAVVRFHSPDMLAWIELVSKTRRHRQLGCIVLHGMALHLIFNNLRQLNTALTKELSSFAPLCHSVILNDATLDLVPFWPHEQMTFKVKIKRCRLEMDKGFLAESVWEAIDEAVARKLAMKTAARIRKHGDKLTGGERIVWILNKIQSLDDKGTPEYRGKQWTLRDTLALDPQKLSAFTLFAIDSLGDSKLFAVDNSRDN